jgi:hypothetical protein
LYWSLVPCFSTADTNMEAHELPALRFQWRHSEWRILADGLTSPSSTCWHLATTKVLLHIQQRSPGHSQSYVLFPVPNAFNERQNTRWSDVYIRPKIHTISNTSNKTKTPECKLRISKVVRYAAVQLFPSS